MTSTKSNLKPWGKFKWSQMLVFSELNPFVEELQFQMEVSWNNSNYSLLFLTSGWAEEIFHTKDYSHGFHQAEKTSFNVMIHTRPNLMRNVGCCYGNSIRWNFSLLASFWQYILKRIIWKGVVAVKTYLKPRR